MGNNNDDGSKDVYKDDIYDNNEGSYGKYGGGAMKQP